MKERSHICPDCNAILRIPSHWWDKEVKCVSCQHEFIASGDNICDGSQEPIEPIESKPYVSILDEPNSTENGIVAPDGIGSLRTTGRILWAIGFLIAAYYIIAYDTSVSTRMGSVNNLSKLAAQQNGAIVGTGLMVMGCVCYVGSRVCTIIQSEKPNNLTNQTK